MSKRFTFTSLKRAHEIRYVFDSSSTDLFNFTSGNDHLCDHLGKFETLGDGQMQHTPIVRLRAPDLIDVCYSLSAHLLAHASDYDWTMRHMVSPQLSWEELEFTARMKGTKTYYSLELCKETDKEEAQYDKRYFKTPRLGDQTLTAFERAERYVSGAREYGMTYWDVFRMFATKLALCELTGCSPVYDAKLDREEKNAFDHLAHVLKALEMLVNAKVVLDYYAKQTEQTEAVA